MPFWQISLLGHSKRWCSGTGEVGRVSPRPQDHRQPIAPARPNAFASGNRSPPNSGTYVLGAAVSERHALPARSPDHYQNHAPFQSPCCHLKLTHIDNSRSQFSPYPGSKLNRRFLTYAVSNPAFPRRFPALCIYDNYIRFRWQQTPGRILPAIETDG
jgi:hypothetical protein